MPLIYKNFQKKYLKSCMKMIQSTWAFEDDLINPKRPEYIYKYYVLNCSNWSEHLDLLVDENEQAQGILFGSIEDTSYIKEMQFYLTQWKIRLGMWWHILNGDLGDRKQAIAVYKNMCRHDADGETLASEFDSEVNLFILSPSLRGQGYGQKLMDRYIEFCRDNDLHTVFLWTTTDCSWHFYEKYGFKERERFSFHEISSSESPNKSEGIVFYKNVC